MTDDLITWLRAQLDEDERAALHIHYSTTDVDMCDNVAASGHDGCTCGVPDRLVAEVDAKRRLLNWLERKDEWASDCNLWTWDSAEALSLLALPYADRPGYRSEWAP